MGYTLEIGEAELEFDEDSVGVTCATVRLDHAPAFGEPTDYQNQRWPSYRAWSHDIKALGLTDVMFGERIGGGKDEFEWKGVVRYPLMSSHPGAAVVTREHVEIVEAKLAAYKILHPGHRAEYAPLKPGVVEHRVYRQSEDYVDDPTYDATLCRGEWLAFWLRWALENCDRPVFVNS